MIYINKEEFIDNLRLTQEYCRLQTQSHYNSNAEILRSYNPLNNGIVLFDFKEKRFEFDVAPRVNHFTSVEWSVDPIEDESTINYFFKDQLLFKNRQFSTLSTKLHSRKILISQIDSIIPDGASEAESLGFIDQYDIPPIDTWFYIARHEWGRLLFTWIPYDFLHDANEAVAVNALDCVGWFEVMLPEEYEWLKPSLRKIISNNLE